MPQIWHFWICLNIDSIPKYTVFVTQLINNNGLHLSWCQQKLFGMLIYPTLHVLWLLLQNIHIFWFMQSEFDGCITSVQNVQVFLFAGVALGRDADLRWGREIIWVRLEPLLKYLF